MYYKTPAYSIISTLNKLASKANNIKNYSDLIDFFIENKIDITIDSKYTCKNIEGLIGDEKKYTGLFMGSIQLRDNNEVKISVYFDDHGVKNAKTSIEFKGFFIGKKIDKEFNFLLDNLSCDFGDPFCGVEAMPTIINVISGYTWFKSSEKCHLNIFLVKESDSIIFEFENIQPDERMRSEHDTALLHLNRVLDNFAVAVKLNPGNTTLAGRRNSFNDYVNNYVKSSDDELKKGLKELLIKYKKK